MNYRLIKLTLLLGAAMTAVFGQSSEVEFYDTTGTTPTAKFGWQGSVDEGNFYIETPGDNTPVTIQNGNLNVDGSASATSFSGDGSGLTGINATGPTATEVANQLKADQTFLDSLKGPQGIQGEKGDKGDKGDTGDTGPAGTTDYNNLTNTPVVYTQSQVNSLLASKANLANPDFTGTTTLEASGPTSYALIVSNGLTNLQPGGLGTARVIFKSTANDTYIQGVGDVSGNANLNFTGANATATTVNIAGDLNVSGACNGCSSDIRFKRNIKPLNSALQKVNSLRGVEYDWKVENFPEKKFSSKHQVGVIAQEVQKVVPEVVGEDVKGYLYVDYQKIVPLLIEAIKEQDKKIYSLNQEIQNLKEIVKIKISSM